MGSATVNGQGEPDAVFLGPRPDLLYRVCQMQTLGLSPNTPKTENRFKALFWPSIEFDTDVDLLTRQGFWVCFVVACLTLGFGAISGQLFAASFDVIFYFLGGVGSRQRSRIAATVMFIIYTSTTLLLPGFGMLSVGRFICIGLMLGNMRAIWLSAKWPPPPPPSDAEMQVSQTFMDKLVERWPPVIWRTTSWLFYILAVLETAGIITLLARRFFIKSPA